MKPWTPLLALLFLLLWLHDDARASMAANRVALVRTPIQPPSALRSGGSNPDSPFPVSPSTPADGANPTSPWTTSVSPAPTRKP